MMVPAVGSVAFAWLGPKGKLVASGDGQIQLTGEAESKTRDTEPDLECRFSTDSR